MIKSKVESSRELRKTCGSTTMITTTITKRVLTRLVLVFAPIILLACDQAQPTSAILNCFTPNMFKMGKVGQPGMGYGAVGGAERANWYPQQQLPYQPGHAGPQMGYGQHPMKLLFQPKWKGGSLFGSKGWNSWKMGANSNFYRPGYAGYGTYGPSIQAPSGGYPFSEQLTVAPFSMPSSLSTYTSSGSDGWSVPITYNQASSAPIQQTPLSSYDSYSPQTPIIVPPKQQVINPIVVDPYGTKGGGTKFTSTTKNNILLADGGYDSYDAHLVGGLRNRTSFGYSYPDWYSGVADSPAKVAQQLMKYGLRKQRQQYQNRSAPFRLQAGSASTQFTILDEPRFVGFGTVDLSNNREARLSCSFNEAIDQTNRPLWIKFLGPYNSSQLINASQIVPPFNCANSQCRTQEVESIKDYRYKFDNGPATSSLIISEPRVSDYGVYRCSALTKAIYNNPLETVYQIIHFGVLK